MLHPKLLNLRAVAKSGHDPRSGTSGDVHGRSNSDISMACSIGDRMSEPMACQHF